MGIRYVHFQAHMVAGERFPIHENLVLGGSWPVEARQQQVQIHCQGAHCGNFFRRCSYKPRHGLGCLLSQILPFPQWRVFNIGEVPGYTNG